jgi:signal transduction histidine kinase
VESPGIRHRCFVRDGGHRVARGLFVVTVALGGAATAATIVTGDVDGNADAWPMGPIAIALGLTGLLIRRQDPHHRCGWSLQVAGLLAALGFAANWWAGQTLVRELGALPGGAAAAWVALWIAPLVVWFGFAWPLLLFPSGQARSRNWWWFGLLAAAVVACCTLVAATCGAVAAATEPALELLDIPAAPPSGWAQVATTAALAGVVAAWVTAAVALGAVAVASRRARGDEWYQLQWLLLGGAVAIVPVLVDLAIVGSGLPQWARSLTALAIPVSMVLAMARHRLYDVDLVVSRTVTAVAVVAAIAIVYVGVVWVLAAVLGEGAELSGPPVVAAAVVALTVAPLARLARRAARRVSGQSPDSRQVVARLGAQLEQTDEGADLLTQLAATVERELRLARVDIRLDQVAADQAAADPGSTGAATPLTVPLVHRGEVIGSMVLVPRPGERLGRADRRLAAELSRVVSVAVAAIRFGEDLEESKRLLERSYEDERRRVRRDLHDGLGPTLASIRLKLGAAQRRTGGVGAGTLDALKRDVADAIREVRRIVDGLQPSTVEDLGLLPAIRLLVEDVNRAAVDGPAVVLEADDDVGELPSALAGTAYRVVGEALANVVRHSRAQSCRVWIHRDGTLDLRISDDGVGFDPALAGGTGLRSIRSRVEELGGCTELSAEPGRGTTLAVTLPVG